LGVILVRIWVSRPAELPRQPLSEPDVNLSIHTAPIKQSFFLPPLPNVRTTLASFAELTPASVPPLSFH